MAAVDLYWLPLGAGGHFVRLNGRLYEAVAARLQRRPARDLYHSALQVEVPEATYVIEQAPVHDWSGKDRGVVAEGAVGARWAGRFGSSATRSGFGAMATSPTWPRPSTARGASARRRSALGTCSMQSRRCRLPSGS
jgi:hypothetical protein